MNTELAKCAIEALDLVRYDAMIRADVASLSSILDDQLVYTHSDGSFDDKQSYLEGVARGKWRYRGLATSGRRLRLYNDTAFVDGNIRIDVVIDGAATMLNCRYLAAWVHRHENWRMIAWHATRIPPS